MITGSALFQQMFQNELWEVTKIPGDDRGFIMPIVKLSDDSFEPGEGGLRLVSGSVYVQNSVLGQTIDANNTITISSGIASPSVEWVGDWTQTRSEGIVRQLVVLAATDASVDGLGGIFTFEYGEDGATALISEQRTIGDFTTVRDFDLLNAGEYFRVKFKPDRELSTDLVFITTTNRRQNDGSFVRLADQEIERDNAAMGQIFSYGKAFDPVTRKSVNLSPFNQINTGEQIPSSPMTSGSIFTGTAWIDTAQIGHFIFLMAGTESFDSVRLQWSDDGTSPNGSFTTLTNSPITSPIAYNVYLNISNVFTSGRFVRTIIANGSEDQSAAQVGIFSIGKEPYFPLTNVDASISLLASALLTRSIIAGTDPDENFKNVAAQGSHTANSSDTPLNGSEIFRGEWFEWQESHAKLITSLSSDVAGTLFIDFSQDASPTDGDDSSVTDSVEIAYDPTEQGLLRRQTPMQSRWVRQRYVNGTTAQTEFNLGAIFMVSDPGAGAVPFASLPQKNQLGAMTRAVIAVESSNQSEYQELTAKADGSIPVTIVAHEAETPIKPLNTMSVGQGSVTTSSAVPIPSAGAGLSGRKTIEYSNHSALVDVFFGTSAAVTENNGKILRAGSDVQLEAGEDIDIYWIAKDIGGSISVGNENGSTTTGTATSTNNMLASDNTYASFASGTTGFVSGFSYSLVLNEVSNLRIGVEAVKDTTPTTQTVAHEQTVVGSTGSASSVTTAPLAGGTGQLYIVSITRNDTNNVSSVSGGGLSFTPAYQNLTGGGRSLDIWYAYGNPTAGGVTVTMSTVTRVEVAVSRLSGAHPTTTVEVVGVNTGTGAAVTGANIAKTANGMGLTAVSHEAASALAGTGYVLQSDRTGGSGANTVSLATETKAFVATGTEAATMTLAGSTDWLAISIRILPAPTIDSTFAVAFDVNGGGYTSAGSLTFDDTEETQYLDITGLHPLTETTINQTTIRLTRTSKGAALGLVDRVFLEVTETSEGNSARISYVEIGDSEI